MKLKIISDGTNKGTKIINLDTGVAVPNATFVGWSVRTSGEPVCTIKLLDVSVELIANLKVPE